MTSLSPYLGFDGNCEEAFEFYRSVFGGEFSGTSRYSEMPPDTQGPPVGPGGGDKIMHIALAVGSGQTIMGSDRPPGSGKTTFGDSVAISIFPDSSEEGRRIFDALSAGGQVTMPYERQFWGDDYGMLRDRFGINWMVDYTPPAA
jgi:PhnB protein